MFRKTISFIALILVLILFAGCAGQATTTTTAATTKAATTAGTTAATSAATTAASATTAGTTAGGAKIPLKISHHPYLHGLPSTYAVKNGLYEPFKYTIDYYANGPVQNEAIAKNAWEVGTTGIAGAVLGITGYNMKVLGVVYDEASVTDMWCRSNSAFAKAQRGANGILGTAADWKGKTVLIATGTNTHLMLIGTLKSLGLNESDVKIVDCSTVPNVYTAFMAGQGDIACIWAPFGYSIMNNKDYTKVGTIGNLGVALPTLAVCTEEAYKNRKDVVKQWLGIFYKASDGLMADTKAAADMMFTFSEQQGIVMSKEASALEFTERPLWSAKKNQDYFKPGANGKTKMYDLLMTYADFMVSQGKLKPEQRDAMAQKDFVSDMVLSLG